MTTLNDAFEWELTLDDEGYESGNESLNILTPLHRTPCLYHVSANENLSFNPATPLTHRAYSPQQHRSFSSIHHHLTFSNDESSSTDSSPLHGRTEQSSPVEQQIACHLTDDSFHDITNEEQDLPNSAIWWWHLDGGTSPRQALVHPWIVTTTWPVPLPLSIQLASATPHSKKCTNTTLSDDGPHWHLWFPRCNDNHQQWRHPWSGWCFLNFEYGE